MEKNTIKLFKEYTSKTLSVDEYCSTISGGEQYRRYLSSSNSNTVFSGMIKWPDNDNPENWGGPFPGNYVAYTILDYSKEKLKTPVEIHNEKLKYVEHNRFNYPDDVFIRLGWGVFNSQYWITEVDGQKCSRNELSDAELILVYGEMTPEEKMVSDIEKAEYIASRGDNHPYNQISTYHPYCIRLFGNDDCSFSYFFNEKDAFSGAYILENPCWSIMDSKFVFTN